MTKHVKEAFKANIYKAKCCGNELHSKTAGHFRTCPCGGAFVDQTSSYVRISNATFTGKHIYLIDGVIQ